MRFLIKILTLALLIQGATPSQVFAKKTKGNRKPASTTVNSELKRTQILIEKGKEEIDEANTDIDTLDYTSQGNTDPGSKQDFANTSPTYEQDNRIGYNLENKTADSVNQRLMKKQIDNRNRENYRRAVRKQFELNAEANGIDPKTYSGDIEKDLEKLEKSR